MRVGFFDPSSSRQPLDAKIEFGIVGNRLGFHWLQRCLLRLDPDEFYQPANRDHPSLMNPVMDT